MPLRKKPELTLPKGKKASKQQVDIKALMKEFYKREWENERNRKANLALLKAFAMFAAAVIYFKPVGEVLFVT